MILKEIVRATRFRNPRILALGHYGVDNYVLCAAVGVVQPNCQVYIVDEGTHTLTLARNLAADRSSSPLDFFRRLAYRCFFGVKIARPRSPIFFTAYTKQVARILGGEALRNSYGFLQENVGQNSDSRAYLLGLPYARFFERRAYLKYVADCLGVLKERGEVTYVAHRHEDLEQIMGFLNKNDCKLLKLSVPFEWYLATSGVAPSVVGTFFSSAMPILCRMLPVNVELIAFKPPDHEFASRGLQGVVAPIYESFAEEQRVKIVELS